MWITHCGRMRHPPHCNNTAVISRPFDETCPRGMRGRGDNGLDNQLNLSPLCPYSSNRLHANLHTANNQFSGESRVISIILLSGTPAFEGGTKIGQSMPCTCSSIKDLSLSGVYMNPMNPMLGDWDWYLVWRSSIAQVVHITYQDKTTDLNSVTSSWLPYLTPPLRRSNGRASRCQFGPCGPSTTACSSHRTPPR